jgi:hypothetical protein
LFLQCDKTALEEAGACRSELRNEEIPMEKLSFEELRQACEGQWANIVSALSSVDLSDALKTRKHVRCHRDHGKTKQQFRVYPDFDRTGGGICNTCGGFSDGFKLFEYLNGWDNRTAIREVAKYLEDRGYRPMRQKTTPPPKPARKFEVDENRIASLQKVWSAAVPLKGTLGEKYLRKRGIDGELVNTKDVRFHNGLHYWDDENEESMGYHPAIVSLVRSSKEGHPLTIHRIYLDEKGGKADVPKAKKLMSVAIDGAISELGAAIRLHKLNGMFMGITEGIETAMAVHAAHPGLPVWAAYSAQVMTNFRPPYGIKYVYIFGDADGSGTGQAAAARLALRLESEGFRAKICLPARQVCMPRGKSGWYTKDATKEAIAERLKKDGYGLIDTCPSKDWLDVYKTSKQDVVNAIHGIRAA